MLATEEPTTPTPERVGPAPSSVEGHSTLLESWPQNDRMRHVPTLPWMVEKLDVDLRRKVERLWLPYSDLPASDPRHAPLETEFRALCRSFDRIADVAKRSRGAGHPPNDLHSRIEWSLSHAITNLNACDAETFGKRFPFQTFERSNAEPLWAAILSAIEHVRRLVAFVREIEPDIDERIYEGLVRLSEPMRREPMA